MDEGHHFGLAVRPGTRDHHHHYCAFCGKTIEEAATFDEICGHWTDHAFGWCGTCDKARYRDNNGATPYTRATLTAIILAKCGGPKATVASPAIFANVLRPVLVSKQSLRIFKMTVSRVLAWLIAVLSVWQLSSAAATNFPSLPPLAPDHVLSLKSRGNTPTSIKFINSSGHPVDVHWVDFVGHPIFYQHLVAAQAYIQQTYVNHPWIIYDDVVSSYVVGFVAIATAADAVIKGPGLQSFGMKPNTISGSDSSSRSSNGKTTVTGPAPVASDCSTAISPTERRICADSSLAKMDQEMGVLYRNLIGKAKDVMAWKADQRAWLVERDRCKNDDGCLRSEYQERLVILRTAEPTINGRAAGGVWTRVEITGRNWSSRTRRPIALLSVCLRRRAQIPGICQARRSSIIPTKRTGTALMKIFRTAPSILNAS